MATSIHPTAIVDPKAELGDGVAVGPYCIVEGEGVRIGDGTRLDAFAQVKTLTSIGTGCHIHSYACLGDMPQHMGYKGEPTTAQIGDRCNIREYVTVHRGTIQGLGKTVVGNDCMLMANVHIAHDCVLGNNVIMSNAASLAGHVSIGNHAIIGGMSGVHQFVRIGDYAFLGAMGGFNLDVPPYILATGVRAKLHGLNLIGLKRKGFSSEVISALKKAYQLLWRSNTLRVDALAEVESTFATVPEVLKLTGFIRETQRGVSPHADGRSGDDE